MPRLLDDTGGLSVEKILLLAVIALPIIIALIAFRDKIIGWFNSKAYKQDGGSSR